MQGGLKMEKNTSNLLIKLGFYPHQLGFGYLVFAITAVANDIISYYSRSTDIFKLLYDTFSVSRSKAIRCMNYSILCAWNNSSNQIHKQFFPQCSGPFPPPVNEFICRCAIAVKNMEENQISDAEDRAG